MKLTEKLKNKRFIIAVAGLVGMAGILAAPMSEAGYWYNWHCHVGPRFIVHHRHHRYYARRVLVRRTCWPGFCFVQRRVWVRK